MPYVEHVDQPVLLKAAMRMLHTNDPNPHKFVYPSLFHYLIARPGQLHLRWGTAAGAYHSVQDLPTGQYGIALTPGLFVAVRAVTATMGASTVPALYMLG